MPFMEGSATWYDNPNMGSCGYGMLTLPSAFGPDAVAAISDVSQYYPGSCGRCFEVQCRPATITSGSGVSYDRTGACHAGNTSIILQIVDECTSVGNTEWCADRSATHLDLSQGAFQRLADPSIGFIGLLLRPIPCAAAFQGGVATSEQYDQLHEDVGLVASRTVFGNGALGIGWTKIPFDDVKNTSNTGDNNLEVLDDGTVALCNAFGPNGGLVFQARPPQDLRIKTFEGASGIEFFLLEEDGTLPGALVSIGNDQDGACNKALPVAQGEMGIVDGWRRFFFPLGAFDCSASLSVADLNRITIQNQAEDTIGFCLKQMDVVPGGEDTSRGSRFDLIVE